MKRRRKVGARKARPIRRGTPWRALSKAAPSLIELPAMQAAPKSQGAQPGNTNAVKHGYYSSLYKQSERRLLEQGSLTDLSAEIELIRVTNKRFLQALNASKSDLDFETQLTALRAVNLSAHSIATLLRAHALTAALDQDMLDVLRDPDDPSPDENLGPA